MTESDDPTTFRIQPEARSTPISDYLTGGRFIFLLVVISILTGFYLLNGKVFPHYPIEIQTLVFGLCVGFIAGVWLRAWRQPGIAPAPGTPPPPLSENVQRIALESGSLIQAIKAYRTETGCGLKESKEAVEAFLRDR